MPEVPARMVEQLGERQFQAALLQMIEDVRGAGRGRSRRGVLEAVLGVGTRPARLLG